MKFPLPTLKRVLSLALIFYVLFSFFSISGTQISALIGFLAWVGIIQSNGPGEKIQLPLLFPIALYTFIGLLAILMAIDPLFSSQHLKKFLEPLLFFWILNSLRHVDFGDLLETGKPNPGSHNPDNKWILFFRKINPAEGLGTLVIVVGVMVALIGLYQGYSADSIIRPSATLNNPITYGVFILLTLTMTLARLGFKRGHGLDTKLIFLALLIQLAGLIVTQTREAWIGALVVFLFFFWKRVKWMAGLTILLLLVYIAASPAAKNKFNSLVTLRDASGEVRLLLWQAGWDILKDYPVLGCGYYCAFKVWKDYKDHENIFKLHKLVHNMYLQIAIDTGVLGFGAWISIWICFFWILYRKEKEDSAHASNMWVRMGSLGGVIGFLVAGVFECHFYDQEIIMLLYLIMALPFAATGPAPGITRR